VPSGSKNLRACVQSVRLQGVVLGARLERVEQEISAERADPVAVGLILAELLHGPGAEQRQVAALQDLASFIPERPEPHAAPGHAARKRGRSLDAARHFGQAFAFGGRSPALLWDCGRLAAPDGGGALSVLGALLKLQPDRTDVRVEMAAIELARENAKAGLRLLRPIRRVSSVHAPRLFRVLAYAFLCEGNRLQAQSADQRWVETASHAEEQTAQAFLDLLN
jgi:hypothetical protein